MNGTQAQAIEQEAVGAVAARRVGSGSMMESVGAIAAIALAIVGLAGVISVTVAAIATIIVGASLLIEGGTAGVTYRQLASRPGESEAQATELSRGVTSEFLGGMAGIVLGILALFGESSAVLMSVAVLVFGAALLLSSASTSQLSLLSGTAAPATGGQVLTGLAAVVLGILAIIGIQPLILVLVALLSLGASALFSGSIIGGRMVSQASGQH